MVPLLAVDLFKALCLPHVRRPLPSAAPTSADLTVHPGSPLVPIILLPENPLPRLQSLLLSSDMPPSTLAPRLHGFPEDFPHSASPAITVCQVAIAGDWEGGMTPVEVSPFQAEAAFHKLAVSSVLKAVWQRLCLG